jgi:hypothetical protein
LEVCGCEEPFDGCKFDGCEFDGCEFDGCEFDGCKAISRTPLLIISNLSILSCIFAIFSSTVLDSNRYKVRL